MNKFWEATELRGVWKRSYERYNDERGYFAEIHKTNELPQETPFFMQNSFSASVQGVLRGMHAQVGQWQLVTVLEGEIQDVLIDINPKSKFFGKSISMQVSENKVNQILVQPGIAHGYCVKSIRAMIHYSSTINYEDSKQIGISWRSEEIIDLWPKMNFIISNRDTEFKKLNQHTELEIFSTET
jgi:dTDP-4-dehydrorhamnose 3,5-epimerase